MDKDTEKKYNELCGIAMTNIFTTTKGWDYIPIVNIDLNNEEHLFVLHAALAIGGAIGKHVAIDKSKFTIWRLNKQLHIKDKDFKITQIQDEYNELTMVDPHRLVEFMRPEAKKKCGPFFYFGEIYREFYKLRKVEKKK